MRLMAITGILAISVALLGGPQIFATRMIHPYGHVIRSKRRVASCWRPNMRVRTPTAPDDPQAQENAASKTWPGDMFLG